MSIGSYGTKKIIYFSILQNPWNFKNLKSRPTKSHTNRKPKVPWVHMTYTLDLGVWVEPTSTFNAPSVLRFLPVKMKLKRWRVFPKTNKRATETKWMDSKWIDKINCIYICMNSNFSLKNLFAPVLITTQDQQKIQKYIIKKSAASIRKMLIDYS